MSEGELDTATGSLPDAPGSPHPDDWGGGAGIPEGRPAGPISPRWAVVRLVAAVAAIVVIFALFHLMALLIVIAAIVVMVMVHELGHFATAKWSRMKVTEYFLGFGPRLWSVRRGETEYGVKAIPAGGYVKIPGMTNLEEVDPAEEERTYRRRPFHNRIIVACAGSFMHFVMAFLLAYGALLYFGTPHWVEVPIAGFVHWQGRAETAAQAAGLKKGDMVTAVNGHRLTDADQLTSTINASPGRPVTLTVDRHGRTLNLTVVPAVAHLSGSNEVLGPAPHSSAKPAAKEEGLIGVNLDQPVNVFTAEGPIRAIGTSANTVASYTWDTIKSVPTGVSSLFADVSNTHRAAQDAQSGQRAQSIIGVTRFATQAEQQGIAYLIDVLVLLNIVIALVNMLPMLPLDGGHVAIALYERIRTRRGRPYYQADVAKLLPVAYAFVAVLAVVVVSAVYLDIAHPVANPFR